MDKLSCYFGFFVLLVAVTVISAEKPLLCYYASWAANYGGNGRCDVAQLDPFLCTHLIYTFMAIDLAGSLRFPDLNIADSELSKIKRFNSLKVVNPKLKTLVAVGGWNEGSEKYSAMAKDPTKRKRFVDTSLKFVLDNGFDGLDIDWEYPGLRGADPSVDKVNFVLLLQELKNAFKNYNLLLTAAVAATGSSASIAYDIPKVSNLVDYINIMTYDYHGSWEPIIGHVAPLYRGPADQAGSELHIDASVKYWLANGAPKEKLILGIPFYGKTFTLTSPTDNKPGASHQGPGLPGPYKQEPGSLGYNEFCEQQLKMPNPWTMVWDTNQQVTYAHSATQWVGLDTVQSIAVKAKYVMDRGLGGAMVWSVDSDDFSGGCGGGKYPLLNTLRKGLNGAALPPVLPTNPVTGVTTITTSPTNTTPSVSSAVCTKSGTFRDPNNCSLFYVCVSDNRKFEFYCPIGLMYDTVNGICNWPNAVDCSIKQ